MDIGNNVYISRRAILDRVNPRGIHIGDDTSISGQTIILSHDYCMSLRSDTYIGKKCFIGCGVIILPGIIIGDEVVVSAGSVVKKDIPSNCIVAGNPAQIIKKDINTGVHGKIVF